MRPPKSHITAVLSQLPTAAVKDGIRITIEMPPDDPHVRYVAWAVVASLTSLALGALLATLLQ